MLWEDDSLIVSRRIKALLEKRR